MITSYREERSSIYGSPRFLLGYSIVHIFNQEAVQHWECLWSDSSDNWKAPEDKRFVVIIQRSCRYTSEKEFQRTHINEAVLTQPITTIDLLKYEVLHGLWNIFSVQNSKRKIRWVAV